VTAGACGVIVDGWSYRVKEDEHGPIVTTVIRADWGVRNHHRVEPREE
jgi:hypothetical protein